MTMDSPSAASPFHGVLGLALVAVCALLGLCVLTDSARASLDIESFTTSSSNPEAGAHPDLSTSFRIAEPGVEEAARSVTFEAPEGIFGNPYAITHCTSSDFALEQCPSDSQAGVITVYANHEGETHKLLGTAPIFDVEPLGEQTALLAFIVPTLNIPINIPVAVRTAGDYGLRFTVQEITQATPLAGANLTIWGFPALDSHNSERFPKGSPGSPSNCPGMTDTSCIFSPIAANIPTHPFTDNPTTCTGALVTRLIVRTYQDPANPTVVEGSYPSTTNCDREVFNPVLFASPTTNETDSASGLNLELSAPQFLGFANSPSELKSATVTMPPGFTINPDAADGQTACPDTLANFDKESPARCPDSSKIGTFAIGTQALPAPLTGAVYLGEPKPGDQYRLFLMASGFGINAKLVGSFRPDPTTGRLTAFFNDLPQVPFDNFQLHLFASDRGLMATPTQCTIYTVDAHFFPWNSGLPDQTSNQIFGLGSGPGGTSCPGQVRPFNPRLVAGTSKPVAGAFSDFTLRLDRDDGDQFLRDLNFKLPQGFTGDLRGIAYCPEAAISAAAQNSGRAEQNVPSCPGGSQIGTTNVAAGPGSHPFHAVGRMFLAGPFKGAPLSLVAVTPALAGPYDYGVVVVRVALHVDPRTAQVSAISDTVPSIIGGIPIRMRSIQVSIDRPNFTINPTNCSAFTVDSEGIGDQGSLTNFSSKYQTVNCATLPFRPRMAIRLLGGKGQTKRTKNPRLRFDLFTRKGDANLRSVAVTLPKSFQVDQSHLFNICSRSQLEADRCEGRQPMGTVWVKTPLLDEPLQGLAYAVSGFGKLPRIVFVLAGQVTMMPQAESTSVDHGHLKTVVPVVPDVPIGHFRLTLLGGSKGYLINSRDLCRVREAIRVSFEAQNGKSRQQRIRPKTRCGAPRKMN